MQSIDLRGELNDYVLDAKRRVSDVHRKTVCKFRQGDKTCRYLGLGTKGYVCMKHSPMRSVLDQQSKENKMTAKGDNCDGLGKSSG